MKTVTSADGTSIAFDLSGDGPPIIFVVGAFNDRSRCAPLAKLLEPRFTVITYDRRGRGDSGDTAPYAIEREIEDLEALIVVAGGSAAVFGYSSGAVLSLKAAAHGSAITKLALYEPPFAVDDDRPRPPADLPEQLTELIAAGRRGDAVELFQTKGIGLPVELVAQLRGSPFWPTLEGYAQSLVYEATITRDLSSPTDKALAAVTAPSLVLNGAETWPALRQAARAVADALPGARHRILPGGQNHEFDPAVVAPALEDFLAGPDIR